MCIRAPTEGWSAADELLAGEFQRARPISLGLVLAPRPESHVVVLVADDPAVGDGAARHVTGQILQHLLRVAFAPGRSLDEDIPFRLRNLGQPGLELLAVQQPVPVFFQTQLAGTRQPTKSVGEFLTEAPAQQDVIHQERLVAVSLRGMPAGNPTSAAE
jgi:hypothetical protein